MTWICYECGTQYGKPRDRIATWHNGKCDHCGEDKPVTEARDYGYPEKKEQEALK